MSGTKRRGRTRQNERRVRPLHISGLDIRFYPEIVIDDMTNFPKRIALLGSTGSIGQQTLDVVRCFPEHFRIVTLAARSNVTLLAQQAQEFQPSLVACFADTPEVAAAAKATFPRVVLGGQGLLEAATHPEVDIVVAATSGLMGLEPTLAAIQAGKTIALANKETLVMAGHL